jgi:hypothetical protein
MKKDTLHYFCSFIFPTNHLIITMMSQDVRRTHMNF